MSTGLFARLTTMIPDCPSRFVPVSKRIFDSAHCVGDGDMRRTVSLSQGGFLAKDDSMERERGDPVAARMLTCGNRPLDGHE